MFYLVKYTLGIALPVGLGNQFIKKDHKQNKVEKKFRDSIYIKSKYLKQYSLSLMNVYICYKTIKIYTGVTSAIFQTVAS